MALEQGGPAVPTRLLGPSTAHLWAQLVLASRAARHLLRREPQKKQWQVLYASFAHGCLCASLCSLFASLLSYVRLLITTAVSVL